MERKINLAFLSLSVALSGPPRLFSLFAYLCLPSSPQRVQQHFRQHLANCAGSSMLRLKDAMLPSLKVPGTKWVLLGGFPGPHWSMLRRPCVTRDRTLTPVLSSQHKSNFRLQHSLCHLSTSNMTSCLVHGH